MSTALFAAARCAAAVALVAALGAPAAAQTQTKDPTFSFTKKEEAAELVGVSEVEWKASAQAGLIMTTGNSRVTTFAAGVNASRKANRNKLAIEAGVAYARSSIFLAVDENGNGTIEESEITRPSQTTTRSWHVQGRYDRFLTTNNSLYALAGLAADKPAGKELVGNGQIGYSRQVYQDEVHLIIAEAGYDFTYEDLVVGDGTPIHSVRGLAGYKGKLSEDTGIDGSVEGLFNLNSLKTAGGQVDAFEDNRIISKVALSTKIFEDVSFRFSFEARYDNAPAPRAPFELPYAEGFVPLADKLDTKTEATLIINFL